VTEEIHDMSRVDAFMATRRRAMIFHSVWKPMLAGAVGAALIVGAVWVASPRLHFNEIDVPRITLKDVTVDHVVTRDVPVDHVIPHDVTVEVPHIVLKDVPVPVPTPGPQAYAPPSDPTPAPRTPAEKKLEESKGWKDAVVHGRLVRADKNGFILMTDDGEQSFYPATRDANGDTVANESVRDDVDPFIGDLGYCREDSHADNVAKQHFTCTALHNGREQTIRQVPYVAPKTVTNAESPMGGSTSAASRMVMVDVLVAQYPVEAMVDTGCSFPMSVPQAYADAMIRVGLATNAGSTPTVLADGSKTEANVVTIKSITVDGRTLHNVEAVVSPSDTAPVLLGLGALNRLGPYSIADGRLVFTGAQPS
jgi:hypothetical protein